MFFILRLILSSFQRSFNKYNFIGGAKRDRTADLLRAKQALSQLSYSPIIYMVGLNGFEPATLRLSGVRSNQLSYRPMYLNYIYLRDIKSLKTEHDNNEIKI